MAQCFEQTLASVAVCNVVVTVAGAKLYTEGKFRQFRTLMRRAMFALVVIVLLSVTISIVTNQKEALVVDYSTSTNAAELATILDFIFPVVL